MPQSHPSSRTGRRLLTTGLLSAVVVLGTPAIASALYEEGHEIMRESKEHFVPVDKGILRASGHVETPRVFGPVAEVRSPRPGPLLALPSPRPADPYLASPPPVALARPPGTPTGTSRNPE